MQQDVECVFPSRPLLCHPIISHMLSLQIGEMHGASSLQQVKAAGPGACSSLLPRK